MNGQTCDLCGHKKSYKPNPFLQSPTRSYKEDGKTINPNWHEGWIFDHMPVWSEGDDYKRPSRTLDLCVPCNRALPEDHWTLNEVRGRTMGARVTLESMLRDVQGRELPRRWFSHNAAKKRELNASLLRF